MEGGADEQWIGLACELDGEGTRRPAYAVQLIAAERERVTVHG